MLDPSIVSRCPVGPFGPITRADRQHDTTGGDLPSVGEPNRDMVGVDLAAGDACAQVEIGELQLLHYPVAMGVEELQ